jgi:DNA-binding GntR family transcriptional regulator
VKQVAAKTARAGAAGPEATRYLRISRDLARDIYGGKYPVGSLLPPETSLSVIYGASRQTIREAMRIISGMGLIARQRGVGTTVLATTPLPAFTQSVASLAELQQYAEETQLRSDRIEHVVARGELAAKLGCPADKIWLRSEGWRIAGEREPPLCWTEVYIDDAFAAVEEDLRSSTGLLFGHLARRFGLVLREVRQIVSAIAMPASLAPRLRVAVGSPALRVERRYFAQGTDPVEIAISIHPGDRFSYSMTLTSTITAA